MSLRIVSFESRRAGTLAALIEERGGLPLDAPSKKEVPLRENQGALAFGKKLLEGKIDLVVFTTGVGATALFDVLESLGPMERTIQALSKIPLVARGPKPLAVLREKGLPHARDVDDPATWRDVLTAIDKLGPLRGKTVAIQEYGAPNEEFIDALVERGAKVLRVPVYRWTLPEDTEPLRRALHAVIGRQADIVLFTNSHQIQQVLRFAQEEGLEKEFREGLQHTVVASVGPVCSEYLDEYGVPVDLEPERPRMENLVEEASRKGPRLLARKRRLGDSETARPREQNFSLSRSRIPEVSPAVVASSAFMKACRREPTPFTPIWLMRQAGRYMKEYRDMRERHSFLDPCKDSDLA